VDLVDKILFLQVMQFYQIDPLNNIRGVAAINIFSWYAFEKEYNWFK
jgi:hypothetical protein